MSLIYYQRLSYHGLELLQYYWNLIGSCTNMRVIKEEFYIRKCINQGCLTCWGGRKSENKYFISRRGYADHIRGKWVSGVRCTIAKLSGSLDRNDNVQ